MHASFYRGEKSGLRETHRTKVTCPRSYTKLVSEPARKNLGLEDNRLWSSQNVLESYLRVEQPAWDVD